MSLVAGLIPLFSQIRAGSPDAFLVMNGDVCADFPLKQVAVTTVAVTRHEYTDLTVPTLVTLVSVTRHDHLVILACIPTENK